MNNSNFINIVCILKLFSNKYLLCMTKTKQELILSRTHSNSDSLPKCRLLLCACNSFAFILYCTYCVQFKTLNRVVFLYDQNRMICNTSKIVCITGKDMHRETGFGSHKICYLLPAAHAYFMLIMFGMHCDAFMMP